MTEAEWLTGDDPEAMLAHLRGRTNARKLRLFGCACCRTLWDDLDDYSRGVLDRLDPAAEGEAEGDFIIPVQTIPFSSSPGRLAVHALRVELPHNAAVQAAHTAARCGLTNEDIWRNPEQIMGADALVCDLVRDVFGNPFRPSTCDPTWRTPDVVALAQAAYDERHLPAGNLDAARLAVLADALEEAGCSEQAMLSHLRGPGPHVRGCWVVDLILNRG
jgi:hypothetical protein